MIGHNVHQLKAAADRLEQIADRYGEGSYDREVLLAAAKTFRFKQAFLETREMLKPKPDNNQEEV